MRKINYREKGITLIALVITIIMLVILVAISIRAIIGDGLINRALRGKEEYRIAEQNESDVLSKLEGTVADAEDKKTGGSVDPNQPQYDTKPVNQLRTGDEIYYTTPDGEEILCQVLYDKPYNDANGTNYGVQVIALSRYM